MMEASVADAPNAKSFLSRFRRSESGAVTVDWVVMTAGIVVLGTIIVLATRSGQEKIAADIDTALSGTAVN